MIAEWARRGPRRPSSDNPGKSPTSEAAEKLDLRMKKMFEWGRFRCRLRRGRAGLAGLRSKQDAIHAALKAPLFHGSQCFRSARQLRTEAIAQPNQRFSAASL